jgi:membrane protein
VFGRLLASIDGWQRTHAFVAFPIAVVKKFLDDRASRLAALTAYYAFFSLFPLLLVLVSVLGFALDDNPELRKEIVDTAVARIPVIGVQLLGEVEPLSGSTVALVVGLVTALWAGLGVMLALERAFNEIWDVPRVEERGPVHARLKGLALLGTLGVGLVAFTALGSAAVAKVGGGGRAIAFAGNLIIFTAVFGMLTRRPFSLREVWPGVVVVAIGSLILQSAGTWYVDRAVTDATATYGTFALVIGLMSWFWLGAHVLLFGAEINVVRHRRLWPRGLAGALSEADREVLERAAQAERSDPRQEIEVTFTE